MKASFNKLCPTLIKWLITSDCYHLENRFTIFLPLTLVRHPFILTCVVSLKETFGLIDKKRSVESYVKRHVVLCMFVIYVYINLLLSGLQRIVMACERYKNGRKSLLLWWEYIGNNEGNVAIIQFICFYTLSQMEISLSMVLTNFIKNHLDQNSRWNKNVLPKLLN